MPKLVIRITRSLLLAFIIGLFPLLELWRTNLGQVANSALLNPLLYTILFIAVVFGLWLLITRSWEKTALLSVLTSIFVFSFGHLYNVLGQKTVFGVSIGFFKLLLVYFILYILLTILILRLKRISSSIFLFGNIVGAALLVINLYPVMLHDIQLSKAAAQAAKSPAVTAAVQANTKPDVYYIVLDAYARADIMKEVTGYDNTPFIDALKARGFYVPDCAFSNYDETTRTITSVLNMNYLDSLNINIDTIDQTLQSGDNLIINNKIRTIFHQLGYQFVTGRGYDSTLDINNSDVYLNYSLQNGKNDNLDKQRFSSLYFNTTILRIISELYKNNPEKMSWLPYWLAVNRESNATLAEASFWYDQNNYMLDSLAKIPSMPGNYFVYAHINSPHGPYVFRADGSFRYPLDTTDEKALYSDTIKYLNKRILDIIDTLQNQSKIKPIIILQADHSIHVLTTGLNKHKILSAYYLPGNISTLPYPTITPVNDFRLILKDYFEPSTQLLPDTLYVKYTNDYVAVPSSCDLNSQ